MGGDCVFFHSTDGLRVEDLCVFSHTAEPGFLLDFSSHSGDFPDLFCYVKFGEAVLRFGGAPLVTNLRTICFPQSTDYSLFFPQKTSCLLVSFRLFFHDNRWRPPHELSIAAPLEQEFSRLEQLVPQAGVSGDLRRKAAFFDLLAACMPEFAQQSPGSLAKIIPGVSALEAQFLQNNTISQYAALCGLRESRFRLLFSEYFGMSPVEYRNTLRMRYAHDLMNQLHCSVADAAQAAGFTSTSYFCRLHRKMFGTSPAGMEDPHGEMDKMV